MNIKGTNIIQEICWDLTSGWYSLTHIQRLLKNLKKQYGNPCLYHIGLKVSQNSFFPNDVDSFISSLLSLNYAYLLNHRGNWIGEYKLIVEDRKSLYLLCQTPSYSYDFNRGIEEGLAQKFGTLVRVRTVQRRSGGIHKIQILNSTLS